MRKIVVALALPVLMAACSSSPPTSEETAAPEVPTVQQATPTASTSTTTSAEDVEKYFKLIATRDPDEQEKAAKLAAAKSAAAAYATHQAATEGSFLDSGNPSEEDSFDTTDKGYTACSDESDDSTCDEYADIKTRDGRVSSFTVNGKSIEGRLTLGQGDKIRAGKLGTVEFVSAYKTASAEAMYVALIVHSGKRAVNLGELYSARYREPGGRQLTASGASASDELDGDSTTRVSVYFKKAKPGGVVTFNIDDAKTFDGVKVKIHV